MVLAMAFIDIAPNERSKRMLDKKEFEKRASVIKDAFPQMYQVIYDDIWRLIDVGLKEACNTIKVPDAFESDKKFIVLDNEDALNSDALFQFMLANFQSRYFKAFAKKIIDYTEGKKQIPEHVLEDFDKFYSLYPKKVKRAPTMKKFMTLKPTTTLFNKIIEGLLKQKYLWNKAGTEKQYIPAPDVWLNQHRWEDEELNSVSLDDLHSSMSKVFK